MAKRSQETRDPNTMATESTSTRRATRSQTKRHKREAATKDWKWLLWDSAFANEYLHQKLGASLTAVLKEACCVRAGVDKDKVKRLREDVNEPLRLWPKTVNELGFVTTVPFNGMVVTVPLLEWCVRRTYKPDVKTFEATARGGDMDAIRWLREHKCSWHEEDRANALAGAARGGHLDVLQWLREEGCRWDERTCAGAARGGHMEVLRYAHENGCPWDESTCVGAARGGHLNVLKYAHENGCPWDERTCYAAAREGHVDVFKYAFQNGCPWDRDQCVQQCFNLRAEGDEMKAWIQSQPRQG